MSCFKESVSVPRAKGNRMGFKLGNGTITLASERRMGVRGVRQEAGRIVKRGKSSHVKRSCGLDLDMIVNVDGKSIKML